MLRKKSLTFRLLKKQPLNTGKNSDAVDIFHKHEINVEKTYTSAGHVLKSNTQNQIEDIS